MKGDVYALVLAGMLETAKRSRKDVVKLDG